MKINLFIGKWLITVVKWQWYLLTLMERLVCAWYCTLCFTCNIAFNSHNYVRKTLLWSPIYGWRDWGLRISDPCFILKFVLIITTVSQVLDLWNCMWKVERWKWWITRVYCIINSEWYVIRMNGTGISLSSTCLLRMLFIYQVTHGGR